MKLRDYQKQAITAVHSYWRRDGGNGLVVLPTGSGKSLVMAFLCQDILAKYPTMRIVIVTHVRELIQQNYTELMTLWPLAPAGIYSAGIGRRDRQSQILLCGIQSVYDKVNQIGTFDLILVDEAHLISKKSSSMYGQFFASIRERTPDVRILGLTASPWRLDSGRLDRGKDKLFDKVVIDVNVRKLIKEGYLSPLLSKATATVLNVDGVGKRGGEFIPGELEIAVDQDWITKAAAKEIVEYSGGKRSWRKSWLAFCSGIGHAAHMRDALREWGIKCETVTGETPKQLRDQHINNFKLGRIQCLTSVGVLGTGFNHPGVDLIALLRPTASAGLFLQQVGRGLRKAKGKVDCLVLDFAGNTARHGPIDTITITHATAERKPGEKLVKVCPECQSIVALACQECPDCGYVFSDVSLPTHAATADATTPILSQGEPKWVTVTGIEYFKHNKSGSPSSLRVEYNCGLLVYRHWACFDHSGFARSKAEVWWKRAGGGTVPRSTDEALNRVVELKRPDQIQIRPEGKYISVVGWRFEKAKEEAA